MALWTGLGQADTVAQLVGADVGGLISMIVQAAMTAQPLAGLGDTLRDAHELVVSCQGRSAAYQFVMAGRTAERFREVQSKIDSYLILFPVISHIGITRRLERIYNVLVQDGSTRDEPSPPQQSLQLQEVLPHGTQEFTLAEIVAATNNFASDTLIGEGIFGNVHRGRLHDGREVAIKRIGNTKHSVEEFCTELGILSRLRHKHIVPLLGSCVRNEKRLLTMRIKEMQRLIVYEYMENGTLSDHLDRDVGASTSSPVTMSWKMRVELLLAVSRAIEHLHCHANPPIIHRDIKSSNILFDASWVSFLSDFGSSVVWDMASEESEEPTVMGTIGYMDPEYMHTGILKPASDVYNLGVVMLEVLTGKGATSHAVVMNGDLVSFALPVIEAGNIEELLDMRPVPKPTPWQLHSLKRVAQVARCCVKLAGKDRPAISDIVANLETAHRLICRDEPGLVDEPCLWPFLKDVEDSPDSPHASSMSSTCYYSDLETDEMLEDGP